MDLYLDMEQQLSIMKPSCFSCLPEDLILECLVRLPNKSRYPASLVCRKWLYLLESPQFYRLAKQRCHINHLACLLQSNPPHSRLSWNQPISATPSHVINVLDPVSRECKRLPPLPNTSIQFEEGTQIVSSQGKLILMNECDRRNLRIGNSLFVFEFSTGRWRQGKSLPTRRTLFAMAASDDCRVFVAGGYHPEDMSSDSAWMYDVRKGEWSKLPPTIHLPGFSRGEVSGNKLVVRTDSMFDYRQSVEIYDFELGEWKHSKVKQSRTRRYEYLPNYEYFALTEDDGKTSICSRDDKRWRFRFYKLSLGDRTLFIYYKKGNDNVTSITIKEEGKKVKIEVPHQIYGDVYSMCSVEVP